MITIIDYGLGNIKAFGNIYKRNNIPVRVASNKKELLTATRVILPGVGSFDQAVSLLNNSGMKEILEELVLAKHVPVLGICVGMQLLARNSEEGVLPGLGWINGTVKKLSTNGLSFATHLPHMGWNEVKPSMGHPLLENLNGKSRFYFLHSYYFDCHSPEHIIAQAEYGASFTCAIANNNVLGVQFHPEKSHENGIRVLLNFANL